MKFFDKTLVNKVLSGVKETHKRKAMALAVEFNAEHAASLTGHSSSTIRTWLRASGLESAINSYHFKPRKAKARYRLQGD